MRIIYKGEIKRKGKIRKKRKIYEINKEKSYKIIALSVGAVE